MPLEILRMKDNDPRLLKFMEEVDERFKEKFGRITHGELFKIQELATKARKQNPHLKFNEAVDIVFEKIAFKKRV